MRNLQRLLAFAALVATTGCYFEPVEPAALSCFNTQYTEYASGETIYFENCSRYAESFLWEFGDGTRSTSFNPMHSYSEPGTYTVILTAYSINGSDVSQMRLTVAQTTSLRVRALLDGTGTALHNCQVAIYANQADWESQTNPVASGTTNDSGEALFDRLLPQSYYVRARKDEEFGDGFHSNQFQQTQTQVLEVGTVNLFVCDMELLYD